MGGHRQLDAAGDTASGGMIVRVLLFCFLLSTSLRVSLAQGDSSDSVRLASARAAFDAGRFEDAAKLAQGPDSQSADLDYLEGLALARLERWPDAKQALEAGLLKAPLEARFHVELAGVAYKLKDLKTAKRELRTALRLNSQDTYTRQFLGTIYFLEDNLDAALKYWNPVEEPRLRSFDFDPRPKLQPKLLQGAVLINAPQVLTRRALDDSRSKLENLGIFPHERVELAATPSGTYDAMFRLDERNGLGDSRLEGIVSLLSGLPYATVYPEVYNLGHRAVNFTGLARWDDQKRRFSGTLSAPAFGDPALRLQLYFDTRNENWNLSSTLFTAGAPLTNLNMRRTAGGVTFRSVVNGQWSWSAGIEVVRRDFRNLNGHISRVEQPFFANSSSVASWLGAERALLKIPEARFSLNSSAEIRAGRGFTNVLGPFATGRASLLAEWFPQAKGDDYQMRAQVRAGATTGRVPLDELFQLGVERDNDLWLRGHAGTVDGRKGSAPLGRRYFLANWEMDKNLYRGAFFNIKVGPFLDSGTIADSSGVLGSRSWLWDAGAQCKVTILGSVTVMLSYGRDLRGGKGVYYGSVLR